jgi:subtilase family serine protease
MSRILSPYFNANNVNANVVRNFTGTDIKNIYAFPAPSATKKVVGVISLGGYLRGTIDGNGILTDGDVQAYWTSIGITSKPVVKIVYVGGSTFDPRDNNSSLENTIDVEMLGACCPTSNLTIILYYINQNVYTAGDPFYTVFNYAINTPVSVNGSMVKPTVISCSWGASESAFSQAELIKYDTLFASAMAAGITITCAAGDHGSSNGTNTTVVDFPSSSPNVVSCGGTTLVCPSLTYSGPGTVETTWSFINGKGTGGGVSGFFKGPPYASTTNKFRHSPDVSLVADPATGVAFTFNNVANTVVGGTSIVSPAIAGLAACLNLDRSLLKILYALPASAYNDITAGQNGAYSSSIGYDRCTGLGTINGTNFVTMCKNLIANSVTSISLPPLSTVVVGKTVQLVATINPAAAYIGVSWISTNANVSVSSTGLVTGVTAGSAVISVVTNDGFLIASTTLTVSPPVVTPVVPPPVVTLPVVPQPIVPITFVMYGPNNRPVPQRVYISRKTTGVFSVRTNSTGPVAWTSSNTRLATVSNGYIKTNSFMGSVIITATSPGLRASVTITIL